MTKIDIKRARVFGLYSCDLE